MKTSNEQSAAFLLEVNITSTKSKETAEQLLVSKSKLDFNPKEEKQQHLVILAEYIEMYINV